MQPQRRKTIQSYEDLTVWRKGVDLVREIYFLAAKLPSSERFALASRLRRAAVSVPANIAEGFGRWHAKEFARFLLIANGSVKEMETHLHICLKLGYLNRNQIEQAMSLAAEISKMLFAIRNKLTSR